MGDGAGAHRCPMKRREPQAREQHEQKGGGLKLPQPLGVAGKQLEPHGRLGPGRGEVGGLPTPPAEPRSLCAVRNEKVYRSVLVLHDL